MHNLGEGRILVAEKDMPEGEILAVEDILSVEGNLVQEVLHNKNVYIIIKLY